MITPFYDRNGITIYCGDCLEIMLQLEPLFDAIICDLPYGTTACAWDTIIPFEPLWENYKRLAKKDGAIILFGKQPFTTLLAASNIQQFRYEWVWQKLVAAQNEGRRAAGIEISEKYCKIAIDRLRQPSFFSMPDKVEAQPEQLALLHAPQGGCYETRRPPY